MTITMTDVLSILRKVADISLVWLVFYLILKIIKIYFSLEVLKLWEKIKKISKTKIIKTKIKIKE